MYMFVTVMETAPFLSPFSSGLVDFLVAVRGGSILYLHLYHLLLLILGLSANQQQVSAEANIDMILSISILNRIGT